MKKWIATSAAAAIAWALTAGPIAAAQPAVAAWETGASAAGGESGEFRTIGYDNHLVSYTYFGVTWSTDASGLQNVLYGPLVWVNRSVTIPADAYDITVAFYVGDIFAGRGEPQKAWHYRGAPGDLCVESGGIPWLTDSAWIREGRCG